jgi:hypothetical protein
MQFKIIAMEDEPLPCAVSQFGFGKSVGVGKVSRKGAKILLIIYFCGFARKFFIKNVVDPPGGQKLYI